MSETGRPRAVFDCMVFLQATASPTGPAARCLLAVDEGRLELVVSDDILREVRDVLNRPSVRAKNSRINDETVRELLERVGRKAVQLADVPTAYPYPRDPKDEPYLNLAIASGATHLVTRDNDLLDLGRAELPEGKKFTERFPGLTILDPASFLKILPHSMDPSSTNPPSTEPAPGP
jgi:putative PIN family toxin of toxin-antitoxin system